MLVIKTNVVVMVTMSLHHTHTGIRNLDDVKLVCSGGTYVDHSIWSYTEEGCSLIDSLNLLTTLQRNFQPLKFTQGPLQSRAMLGDQVVACAEVI